MSRTTCPHLQQALTNPLTVKLAGLMTHTITLKLVSAAQSEGCTDGLGGGGGDEGAGEGVMSTSDSVMLVTVVTGSAVVVGISVDTELGTTNDTVDELRVTDDTGIEVNDVELSSKEEGGKVSGWINGR